MLQKTLKKPTGFHLLVNDFAYHYPENVETLTDNFLLYKQNILDLAVKKYSRQSDQGILELIEEYKTTITEESAGYVAEITSIYAFSFLPLLLGIPVTKNKKKQWRRSKQEPRDAFLTHVKAETELKETNLNEIKNYYIVVNDIFYVVDSILQAVVLLLIYSIHCIASIQQNVTPYTASHKKLSLK